MQADFTSLGLLSVDEALRQKVSEGSKVRILFLDPFWDFIDQIARDEGILRFVRAENSSNMLFIKSAVGKGTKMRC